MTSLQNISHRLYFRPLIVAAALATFAGSTFADLYIRDDPNDTGAEPNPSSGPMWTSPDIWVRNDPLPGWNPRPYQSANPPAWVDATHFNPDYRSPLSGKPNYVYVRIKNKGSASSGSERLLLYWASASTGLTWDPAKVAGSFIDNVQNGVLFGSEITKVRKNAATATQAERDAYIAALRKIATDPAFIFPGGLSYWRNMQEVHRFGPTYRHGFNGGNAWVPSVAFLPWHREMVNRYEGLLQEADPKVKLLYWQWTQNPTQAPLDYTPMMGAFGTGNPASAVQIGAPLSPDTDPGYPNAINGLSKVTRRLQPPGNPLAQSDATVVGRVQYDLAGSANNQFSGGLESFSHNNSHVYIASTPTNNNNATAGDQLFQPYAARDPFFFLLHAKVDELWARWQRKSLDNLDPATTFGTAAGNVTITGTMGPWDGTAVQSDGLPNSLPAPELDPWTSLGGQIYAKPANDRSITSPPFYDTAPLTIPALQPGEELILEIPWYPPNPAGFGNIADPQHVCLIARIETSTNSPFGMTVAETTDINFNTQQNNNIAWRNVSVVDTFPGPFRMVKFLLANGFREPVKAGLRFGARLGNRKGTGFFERGTVRVDLGRELVARWRASGANAQGVEAVGKDQLRITREDAVLNGIELKPGEQFPVRLTFELKRDYAPTKIGQQIIYDVVQIGTPRDPNAVVGGQRYQVAVNQLTPVERGRIWRWLPGNQRVSKKWSEVDFDDSDWFKRKLDLGWVEPDLTAHCAVTAATYYFRYDFDVDDPAFFRNLLMKIKRSDGAVAYLNGKEVYRNNLPDGGVTASTLARAPAPSIERDIYFPVKLDPAGLRKGRNVIAVEIHRAERGRGGLAFDLELNANVETTQQAPYVKIANIPEGTLLTEGSTATINVDAVKLEGSIRSATLIVDDKPVQTLERPPFSFKWPVQSGPHRLNVVVTDNEGMRSNAYSTVTGVKNVPPVVAITQPAQHTEIAEGDALAVVARAEDPDGKVAKVEFYVHDSYIIGSSGRLVGTVTEPPYTVTIGDLKVGHAMVTAVATDEGGARTASIPIMVIVTGRDADAHIGHH
jgi:hypothetical protein